MGYRFSWSTFGHARRRFWLSKLRVDKHFGHLLSGDQRRCYTSRNGQRRLPSASRRMRTGKARPAPHVRGAERQKPESNPGQIRTLPLSSRKGLGEKHGKVPAWLGPREHFCLGDCKVIRWGRHSLLWKNRKNYLVIAGQLSYEYFGSTFCFFLCNCN